MHYGIPFHAPPALLELRELPYLSSKTFADQHVEVVPPHSQAGISLLESRPSKAEQVTCVWDLAIACLYFASRREVLVFTGASVIENIQ